MFIQNKDYKRSELHDEFGGNRQRGISNCVNHPIIFIFSNPNTEQQDVYIDEWRDSNDDERLDVDNGILLTPNLDGLFDKYLITFDDNGKIVFSKKLDINELTILGINNEMKISSVNSRMKNYLKRHREKFYEQEK